MARIVTSRRQWGILGGAILVLGYTYWSARNWNIVSVERESELKPSHESVMPRVTATSKTRETKFVGGRGKISRRHRDAQKVVILMTQFRSGSSFTGRIFSATKGSMYLYEPMLPFGMGCTRFEDFKLPFLSRLLSCNFTNLQDQYAVGFKGAKYTETGKCVKHGLCFAGLELRLDYTRTCYRMLKIEPPDDKFHPNSLLCGFPLKEKILNQLCADSDIVFTKVTRVCSLDKLQSVYDILKRQGKEIYVIHLVRDPRSTSYSRYTTFGQTKLDADVICTRMKKTVDITDVKSPGEVLDASDTSDRPKFKFYLMTLK